MTPPPNPRPPVSPNHARWQNAAWILLAAAGVLLVLFFGMRALRSYVRMRQIQPGQGTPDIAMVRGWMTVEYISTVYQVPQERIFEALNIPAEGNASRSLSELTRQYYPRQPGVLANLVRAAIQAYRAEQQPPPLPPLETPPTPPLIPNTPPIPAP